MSLHSDPRVQICFDYVWWEVCVEPCWGPGRSGCPWEDAVHVEIDTFSLEGAREQTLFFRLGYLTDVSANEPSEPVTLGKTIGRTYCRC